MLLLIDLPTVKILKTIEGFKNKVRCLEISNDGKFVATGGDCGDVLVYGTNTGNEFANLKGHRKNVMGLAWSPDDKQLAAVSRDQVIQVRVWTVADGKLMVKIKCKTSAKNVQWVEVEEEKIKRLVVGEQKAIGMYDVLTGERVSAIPTDHTVWATAVEPKTGNIAAGLANSSIAMFSKEGKEIRTFAGHEDNIRALVFGEGYLFSASNDRSVRAWKL